MSGDANAPNWGSVPVPDPTKLTTEAVSAATRQWNHALDSQAALLQAKIDALRALLDERYATQTKALDAAFVAAEKAVATALSSAEKAVAKAEASTERRFEGVNEFRAQLADQARTFVTKAEYDAKHEALVVQVRSIDERLTRAEGANAGSKTTLGTLLTLGAMAVAVVIAVVTIILKG